MAGGDGGYDTVANAPSMLARVGVMNALNRPC
jgi:hypothetical protein